MCGPCHRIEKRWMFLQVSGTGWMWHQESRTWKGITIIMRRHHGRKLFDSCSPLTRGKQNSARRCHPFGITMLQDHLELCPTSQNEDDHGPGASLTSPYGYQDMSWSHMEPEQPKLNRGKEAGKEVPELTIFTPND